ncbi:MAG TPA: lysophospholipid acyltransferase family protein [Acidobacteriota bacterium]|jgi:1-acyl-sn-glycerol-3-phosphate acyltransferase
MKILYLLRAFILVPVILLWTAAMAVVSLIVSFFDKEGRLQHGCARIWARFILWISGVTIRVAGLERIGAGPYIFACNHQSFFDIFAILAGIPVPFRFFAKESLFRVPFLGWHLRRAGHLPVDRSNARAAYASFQSAAERVRSGTSVLIFPEGSRSETGEVGAFRKGSLRLSVASGVPVMPLAVYGSRFVLPKGSMLISPGEIDLSVGRLIEPSDVTLKDKDRLVEEVRSCIVEQYRRLQSGNPGRLRWATNY